MKGQYLVGLSLLMSSCSDGSTWGDVDGDVDNGLPGCVVASTQTGLTVDESSDVVGGSLASVLESVPPSMMADFAYGDGIDAAPFAGTVQIQAIDPVAPVEARSYDELASAGDDCLQGPTFTFLASVAVDVEGQIDASANQAWVTVYGTGQIANMELAATVSGSVSDALEGAGVRTDGLRLLWTRSGLGLATQGDSAEDSGRVVLWGAFR
jgi:hypothetical protein